MKITFQRNKLYKEVWDTPISKLAETYGITHHQLTKVCKELNIPRPPSGYWTKIRYGKKVNQIPLPDFDLNTYELRSDKRGIDSVSDNLPKSLKPIKVNKHLRNPHPLVKRTRIKLKEAITNHFKRLQPLGANCLDVSISKDCINRGMRILNALIKELIRQEFEIGTEHKKKYSKSFALIKGEKVYFQLREEGYRQKMDPETKEQLNRWGYSEYEYFTTGRLRLYLCESAYGLTRKSIGDTKSKNLEERLDEFFPLAFDMAANLKDKRIKREEQNHRWERQRRLNTEATKQNNAELKQRELLAERAEAFTKTRYMYDFIDQIEKMGSQYDLNFDQKYALKGWVHWAHLVADLKNPLKQAFKEIIDDKEDKSDDDFL